MINVPESVRHGTVKMHIISGSADSKADDDLRPDAAPVNGTIILKPTVSSLKITSATPPTTMLLDTLRCPIIEGVLYPPGTELDETETTLEGVTLVSSDQPATQPTSLQWQATFDLSSTTQLSPITFNVPVDGVIDLTTVIPAVASPGTVNVITTETADRAELAADTATSKASEAASSATAATSKASEAASSATAAATSAANAETTPLPLDILVQTTDDRMMQPAGPLDAFSEVITDREGHVVVGIQSDGAVYIHNLVTDSVGVGENVLAVAAFGDSMVAGQSGGGLSFSGFLETALGYPVFHGGWGGQTSTEIGFRAGGVEIWARIPSGSIAASGATVLEITLPGGMWRPDSTAFDVIAHLEDGTRIPGTLRKSTTQEWTFTPTGLSSAKPVPREVKFVSVQALENSQRGYIFRAGRNNIDLETIVRDYRLVRDWVYSTQPQARFLALPLYNDSSNTVGSVPYNTVMEINEALAEVCGRDFYDLRRWVIRYGLSAAGIPPTPQDLTDMENDVIPVSLRFDPVHPNAAGREVEAKQVAAVIKSRGWFD